MAKEYREEGTQTVPGGQIGGRVRVPLFVNQEGIDASVDPDGGGQGGIYSGMKKREARQTGCFSKEEFNDIEFP